MRVLHASRPVSLSLAYCMLTHRYHYHWCWSLGSVGMLKPNWCIWEMNFSKHRCLGQEWHRLLEAVEMTVSRSILCLGFVVLIWRIGRPISIAQLPSRLVWLGACYFYLSYFSSFLPFCLSFNQNTNDSLPGIISVVIYMISALNYHTSTIQLDTQGRYFWIIYFLQTIETRIAKWIAWVPMHLLIAQYCTFESSFL